VFIGRIYGSNNPGDFLMIDKFDRGLLPPVKVRVIHDASERQLRLRQNLNEPTRASPHRGQKSVAIPHLP